VKVDHDCMFPSAEEAKVTYSYLEDQTNTTLLLDTHPPPPTTQWCVKPPCSLPRNTPVTPSKPDSSPHTR
jgi:hypothetical protein